MQYLSINLSRSQVPYCLRLSVGGWSVLTSPSSSPSPAVPKGSRSNVWPAVEVEGLQTLITADVIRSKRFTVQVVNIAGEGCIGEGSFSLRSVGTGYSRAVTVAVKMKDGRGRPKGRVDLVLQVDPVATPHTVSIPVSPV